MIELYVYYALLLALVFFLSMSSLPRNFKLRRSIIVLLFISFTVGSYYSFTRVLGNPTPLELIAPWDVPTTNKAEIIGFWFVENEGIYLLLMHEGLKIPKYYKYPWSKELAQQIQGAAEEATKQGKRGPIYIGKPFQRSWEDVQHPFVHPLPQLMRPSKPPAEYEIIDINKAS